MTQTLISFERSRPAWSIFNRAITEVAESVWGMTGGRRRRLLLQTACEMDLTYHTDAIELIPRWVARFPLFQLGGGGPLYDGLRGRFLNVPVRVFDYCPREGGSWRTVVVFELRHGAVPRFALWPADAGIDPSKAVGRRAGQVPATERRGFDQKYHLFASNQTSVRALFHRRALDYFDAHGGWRVEGGGRWIAIYREGVRAHPRKLREFLMDVFQAFRPLRLG